MDKYIRIVAWEIKDGKRIIKDISEFTGGINDSQVFRRTGTCTRLFSRRLKSAIEQGDYVIIEKSDNWDQEG